MPGNPRARQSRNGLKGILAFIAAPASRSASFTSSTGWPATGPMTWRFM